MKKTLQISFCIIGAILGAGFASGKEIYLFFGQYGNKGKIGIIISFITIGIIINKTIKIANDKKIENNEEFLKQLGSKTGIIKAIINIFLLITYYIMISAYSAYFKQELNIPQIIGSITIVIINYITLRKNIQGIIKTNQILIPILIIVITIFGIKNITSNQIPKEPNGIQYITSAILYASYNSITLIPMLITLRKQITTQKENKKICIITTITLITLAFAINTTIQNIDQNINKIELPTVYIVSKEGTIAKYIYGAIILTSIYTTAITTLYSFLKNNCKTEKQYKKYNIIINASAIIISNISFTTMLSKIYPIFGILGLIQIYKIFTISLEKKA